MTKVGCDGVGDWWLGLGARGGGAATGSGLYGLRRHGVQWLGGAGCSGLGGACQAEMYVAWQGRRGMPQVTPRGSVSSAAQALEKHARPVHRSLHAL